MNQLTATQQTAELATSRVTAESPGMHLSYLMSYCLYQEGAGFPSPSCGILPSLRFMFPLYTGIQSRDVHCLMLMVL